MKTFSIFNYGIFAFAFILLPYISKAQCNKLNYSADGPVFSSAYDSSRNLIYIGGSFNSINPFITNGAFIDSGTNEVDRKWPVVDYGSIYTVVSDLNGGYYIGGSFGTVGDSLRSRLAHIDSTGKVSAWNPRPNFSVNSIIVTVNTVYIGGDFTAIGGIFRNCLGAVNRKTGKVTSWNPNPNGSVKCMFLYNDILYVGGGFTIIGGGNTRNNLAQLDTSTGFSTAWNPKINGKVTNLVGIGKNIYVAGDFTKIDTVSRRYLAAIDTSTAIANTWNPALVIGNSIGALSKRDSILYIGGTFQNIAGFTRRNAAAMNTNTNSIIPWNPKPDNSISCIIATDSSIYITGDFTAVGDTLRYGLAEVNDSNGIVTNRNFNAGSAYSMDVYKGRVFIGNKRKYIGGYRRNNIAAIDPSTGNPIDWKPDPNNAVLAIALKDNKIYIGGYFSRVGGKNRTQLAELTTDSNAATKWNPRAGVNGDEVFALQIIDSLLYVGGDFDSLGGKSRKNIGAVNLTTGITTSWSPSTNSEVHCILHKNNSLFIGGFFTYVNGQSRQYIAEFSIATGGLTSWNPSASDAVIDMTNIDNTLYIGGNFNMVGGVYRNYIAALNMTTGKATSWNPGADNTVLCMINDGKNIYAGGYFTTIGGKNRNCLAALDVITGVPTSLHPNLEAYPETILLAGNALYFGGQFTTQINQPYNYFGGLTMEPIFIKELAGISNVCNGSNALLSIQAKYADTYQWQVSINGGNNWSNLIDTGNYSGSMTAKLIITKATSNFNNYLYRCIINGCKSVTGVSTTLKVIAIPIISNTIPSTRCGNGNLQLQVVTSASKVMWYDTAFSGKRLDSSYVFTTPNLSMSKLYYVEAISLGCASERIPVKANIDTMPQLSIPEDTIYRCGIGSLELKALANLGSLYWYQTLSGGTSLKQDSIYTTPVLSQKSVYYVESVNGVCTTTRSAITAIPKLINISVSVNSYTITAAQVNAQYKWINCVDSSEIPGANQKQFSASTSGSYAVIVTYDGCTDTSICSVVQGTSISQIDATQQFSLYPNPSIDITYIKSIKNGVCIITNLTGQIVAEYELNELNNREASISNLSPGVYYVTYSYPGFNSTQKLIILK